jgi:hypothetical protein
MDLRYLPAAVLGLLMGGFFMITLSIAEAFERFIGGGRVAH